MAEPWLDSLSEDWKSEHFSSSPSTAASSRRASLKASQSRIPHLRHSLRKESSSSGHLKLRSQRGLARSHTAPALSERSPSSLNAQNKQHVQFAEKTAEASTLPRRASSVFSDSQNSVQHYSLKQSRKEKKHDTPEWKRRVIGGTDAIGEGVDLFSPTKLEGIFSQPLRRDKDSKDDGSSLQPRNPWSFLDTRNEQPTYDPPPTFRTSRSRIPVMEVVEEVSEDEKTQGSASLARNRTRDTSQLTDSIDELKEGATDAEDGTDLPNDPRLRTASGREEILHEDISLITISKQNSIRERAFQHSTDLEAGDLQTKLRSLDTDDSRRPSSSSSDRDIDYFHQGDASQKGLVEDSRVDLTTHSLPDDLSMGTQEFASHGGFVNARRGGHSDEGSFHHRALSSHVQSSNSHSLLQNNIRSSPPPYQHERSLAELPTRLTTSLPATPGSASVVHHVDASSKGTSSGSPLKLFGNRDTFTNNKLLRVLSQFEDGENRKAADDSDAEVPSLAQEEALRISQFGKGDLDAFGFSQHIEPPTEPDDRPVPISPRIFQGPLQLDMSANPRPAAAIPPSRIPRLKSNEQQPDTRGPMLENGKRLPDSPRKDRTPKRRRTLLRDELQIPMESEVLKIEITNDATRVAGTKHKNSRSVVPTEPTDPNVLASRTLLRPRTARRRSSISAQQALDHARSINDPPATPDPDTKLTEALAAELASFTRDVQETAEDSRKPSYATKDFMDEAGKVMQFIRARGKPKPQVQEPHEVSELNPDAILDLDVDAESTIDNFSRPPSREGIRAPPPKERNVELDPRQISHLRKFQDDEDVDLISDAPVQINSQPLQKANTSETQFNDQESSPPNIKIRDHGEAERKGDQVTSTSDRPSSSRNALNQMTQGSSESSTRRTFPTSSSSGNKGHITSGLVAIPDQVGTMTFDRNRKIWISQKISTPTETPSNRRERQTRHDEDPFENIPDLSVDEQHGAAIETGSQKSVDGDKNVADDRAAQTGSDEQFEEVEDVHPSPTPALQHLAHHSNGRLKPLQTEEKQPDSIRSQLSNHELNVHNGLASEAPHADTENVKQPRVVTITFSSPLVSAFEYPPEPDFSELDLDDGDDLPLDDSGITASSAVLSRADEWAEKIRSTKSTKPLSGLSRKRHEEYRAMIHNRRPVSRIEEREEEHVQNVEMSIVRFESSVPLATPVTSAGRHIKSTLVPVTSYKTKDSSLIALTPLSEFSFHQVDNARHPEQSYVSKRAQPKSLRQAHGLLALAEDELVKAITDAEQSELFWENEPRLDLSGKKLTTLHGLDEYCGNVQVLNVQQNRISQLEGAPRSIRLLNIASNALSNLTSWGALHNLQYADVSGNQLENLDGLSSLIHLRDLNVSSNQLTSIEGVFDLDALLNLNLSGNMLTEVNLEGCQLSRLQSLNMSRNKLTSIRNLHVFSDMKNLDLSENNLKDLFVPQGTVMSSLSKLNLAGNHLEGFDFGALPSLQELDLNRNAVNEIVGLENATDLQVLSIREQSNAPDIINVILSTPNECHTIFLGSNIAGDPESSMRLPLLPQYNLRTLEVASCGIAKLPEALGDYLPNVRDLNLAYNAIRDLEPLQGLIKLEKLNLVGNRIKRLRRTCLLLTRLGSHGEALGGGLQQIDIRDNPVALGFYAPTSRLDGILPRDGSKVSSRNPFALQPQDRTRDHKWRALMDETTAMKRRMVELLLRQGCPDLRALNGLNLDAGENLGEDQMVSDMIWDRLMGKGVLIKAIAMAPVANEDTGGLECNRGRDNEQG